MTPRLLLAVCLTIGLPHVLQAQADRLPPPGWPHSPKQFEAIRVATDLMIPTRDGARMATDIYRPAKNGVPVSERLPVLLNRTPYDKGSLAAQAVFYAERGYVVALQDTRGRYKSEGRFSKVQPLDATESLDQLLGFEHFVQGHCRIG